MKRATGAVVATLMSLGACDSGSRSARSAAPWTTAFDSTGDTIVARTTGDVPNDAVRRLVLEQRVGEAEGNDTVTFGRIDAIAVATDDRAFVFDNQGPSLKLFDSTGGLLRFVGRKGAGPGEFEQVTGMGILPNGSLAIWDASHARINVYSSTGEYERELRAPVFGWFTSDGLHTDATGAIVLLAPFVSDQATGNLGENAYIRLDSTGAIRDTVRFPRWIDSTPMLKARSKTVRAMLFLPFAPQVTYTWHRTGALLSGPAAPYIVYRTHAKGRPLRIEREWTPVPVLAEEADDERALLTWDMREIDPSWNWSGPGIPKTKPAYSALISGEDGRIWVALHATGQRVDSEEEPAASDRSRQRPARRYVEPNVYDVFESGGAFLGRVRAERSQRVLRMRGNRVWGVLSDSLGVGYFARWRVEPPFPAPATGR
jgi:hypothetical protein